MEKTREESRRRFQEALNRIYFPVAPSPPPSISQETIGSENNGDGTPCEIYPNFDPPVEDERSENEEGIPSKMGERKMTRSQRKRFRKRKLKESAAVGSISGQRGKIIGPMMPPNCLRGDGSDTVTKENI